MPVNDPSNDSANGPANGEPRPTTVAARKERKRRRFINRRNAIISGIALAVGICALVIVAFMAYRLGFVDRYVASQVKTTFSKYGIRAEIKNFHTTLPPNAVEMQGIELYDAN